MGHLIYVLGVDPAFSNMGFATATIDLNTLEVTVLGLALTSTDKQSGKTVRKSSDDLRRAIELKEALCQQAFGCALVMAEIPTGSLSAAAARSLGIAVGVLASSPVPIVQVSPTEVKMCTVGKKNASKDEMILWATRKFPKAKWFQSHNGYAKKNEHLADAIAAIYAGIKTPEFKQLRSSMIGVESIRVPVRQQRRKLL